MFLSLCVLLLSCVVGSLVACCTVVGRLREKEKEKRITCPSPCGKTPEAMYILLFYLHTFFFFFSLLTQLCMFTVNRWKGFFLFLILFLFHSSLITFVQMVNPPTLTFFFSSLLYSHYHHQEQQLALISSSFYYAMEGFFFPLDHDLLVLCVCVYFVSDVVMFRFIQASGFLNQETIERMCPGLFFLLLLLLLLILHEVNSTQKVEHLHHIVTL